MPTLSADLITAMRARLESAGLGAGTVASSALGPAREPVHTVYGGAHLFRAETARKLGDLALRALEVFAPDASAFAAALDLPGGSSGAAGAARDTGDGAAAGSSGGAASGLHAAVYERVVAKLRREPVEDLRIDFEDGYGVRPDEEEDGHAVQAAREVARGLALGSLPGMLGIRVKALTPELCGRSLRTLDLFLSSLVAASGGSLPEGFVVTLPKVEAPEQVAALVEALEALEGALGLARGAVWVEIMVETPSAVVAPDGSMAVRRLCSAGRGRCVAVHFGPYDYTASLGIPASQQRLSHPACDVARGLLQVAVAGTGIRLSDGPTNVLPVEVHRGAQGALGEAEREENRRAVVGAWRLHAGHVRRALERGIGQGWDLHPAQLPARYGAVYAFYLEGLAVASQRLRNFLDRAAQATRVGAVFDDAATGQGLLGFFLRGVAAGALTEEEAVRGSTLSLEELRSRSFARIVAQRSGQPGA
ncbi:DUF6986 family protein [Chondromyces crocatus]|uniref:Uncharacterized protein n=1 Tax=Chondromyces crocatus TaxID=52 RepID=A0A0K1ECC5_CHOCO|nr:aldolase/citrate lyase family protein [Chondromyces crocatus]AKT38504.1 uncharacterized protein CMC5_026500 [Chondromyces crocatus]